MSNIRVAAILAFTFALAACDRTTSRQITGPDRTVATFGASFDRGPALTADGPFDQLAASEDVSAEQAATGGRATGHVGFAFNPPFAGVIVTEKYSFVALSISPPPPFAAKGQYEIHLSTPTSEQRIHGEVTCLSIVGNQARIGGRITKVWINNIEVPTVLENFWTVTDNGEGQGTSDGASLMRFIGPGGAQIHCAVGFALEQLPPQEGNVQVSSR